MIHELDSTFYSIMPYQHFIMLHGLLHHPIGYGNIVHVAAVCCNKSSSFLLIIEDELGGDFSDRRVVTHLVRTAHFSLRLLKSRCLFLFCDMSTPHCPSCNIHASSSMSSFAMP